MRGYCAHRPDAIRDLTLFLFFDTILSMDIETHGEDTRDYEVAVLMANDTDEPSFEGGIAVIQKEGPQMVALAYPIKNHASATLRVYIIRCAPNIARGLDASLKSHQAIIRHLIITPPVMTSRRMPQSVVREREPILKNEPAKPASSEAVSNKTLEEVLEKILEHHEPQ